MYEPSVRRIETAGFISTFRINHAMKAGIRKLANLGNKELYLYISYSKLPEMEISPVKARNFM